MAKEKFVLVSLKEDKAKQLAQVITNDSCRKILDYLAEKEATETELAEKLNIPLSTVHYNLKNLMDGGLVTVDEYHYSKKGKEVNHYKLANKYIIIAPKSTWGIKEKLKSILPVILIIGLATAFIQTFSKMFIKVGTTNIFTSAKQTLVRETVIEKASDSVFGAAMPEAALVKTAAMDEAMTEIVNKTTEHLLEPVVQTTTTYIPPSILSNIALWFLIGSLSALIIYFTIDYIKNRKK